MSTEQGTLQHLVTVNFDMRKLGVTPEFGLEVTNEVAEKKFPQYTLDLHVNNQDKKYHMHVYSQPDYGSKWLIHYTCMHVYCNL